MGYINEQYYILSLAKAIVLQDEIPIDKSVNWKVIYNSGSWIKGNWREIWAIKS